MPLKDWFSRMIDRVLFGPPVAYPSGGGGGLLGPGLRYLAVFVRGEPEPVAVVVFRLRVTNGPRRSGVSVAVHATRGSESPPMELTWHSDSASYQVLVHPASRRLVLYGRDVAWTDVNLFLVDGRSGGAPATWPVEDYLVVLPGSRERQILDDALRALEPVKRLAGMNSRGDS